ncbi:MAG: SLBB domain-containing protein [Candidatus Omnitrophica bacterium]|nr:SLBB domain-containing protein [Candidatus Omnitrophota bacterium]
MKYFIFVLIFLLPAAIYSQNNFDEVKKDIAVSQGYRISMGDTLKIAVFKEPELDKIVKVSAEGKITFPLIGEVQAAGFTTEELARKIEALLEKGYLANPQVNVFIKEYAKFFILGAVENEGAYELDSSYSLSDVIAMAGGAIENANLSKIEVVRKTKQGRERYLVDLDIQGNSFLIEPFDRILIKKYGRAGVFGEVRNPGRYYLEKDMTAADIISVAGGANKQANLSEVKIKRKTQEEKEEFVVNLEKSDGGFYLSEGDKVEVPSYEPISIFGQVRDPGSYPYRKGMTIVEVIAQAGGFTDIASRNNVLVIRKKEEGKKTIKVPVGSILKGAKAVENLILEEGDTIRVQESFF